MDKQIEEILLKKNSVEVVDELKRKIKMIEFLEEQIICPYYLFLESIKTEKDLQAFLYSDLTRHMSLIWSSPMDLNYCDCEERECLVKSNSDCFKKYITELSEQFITNFVLYIYNLLCSVETGFSLGDNFIEYIKEICQPFDFSYSLTHVKKEFLSQLKKKQFVVNFRDLKSIIKNEKKKMDKKDKINELYRKDNALFWENYARKSIGDDNATNLINYLNLLHGEKNSQTAMSPAIIKEDYSVESKRKWYKWMENSDEEDSDEKDSDKENSDKEDSDKEDSDKEDSDKEDSDKEDSDKEEDSEKELVEELPKKINSITKKFKKLMIAK